MPEEEKINIEKRQKLKKMIFFAGAIVGVIMLSKSAMADVFLGYKENSPTFTTNVNGDVNLVTGKKYKINGVSQTTSEAEQYARITYGL
jgi:uncharacterized lipoprotein YehR (DUF1307 family)